LSTARVPSDRPLPLTGAQLGIWNAQRLEPDSPYYVVGDVIEIRGEEPVDTGALAEAVRAVHEEAETLRLRVHDTPDGPRQTVSDTPVPTPRLFDVAGEADPRRAAEALVEAERERAAQTCRDMVDRPLYSPVLIRVSDREVWYTQLGHHRVIDGYSGAMLARRTAARYTALVRGAEPPRPAFGTIEGLVAADRAYRESARAAEDRAYWVDRFTPLPDVGEPGTAAGPPGPALTARTALTPDETARLRAFADREGVTWGEAVIACYAAFLHRVLGRADVVFALPLMCRTEPVELRTPAMAVNVLPLRVTVRPGDGFGELTRRVAGVLRETRRHQRYRGEDLPRDLGVPGAGALLHGRGINLKAFDLALDFAGARGVMRNVAGGPPEDMGLSVLPAPDGGLLLGFEVDARTNDRASVDGKLAAGRHGGGRRPAGRRGAGRLDAPGGAGHAARGAGRVRRDGRRGSRAHRAGLRGGAADGGGPGGPGAPAGPRAAGPRHRPRRRGGARAAPLGGPGGRAARGAGRGRRVPAAGPRPSA
jgi:hypothetical protein